MTKSLAGVTIAQFFSALATFLVCYIVVRLIMGAVKTILERPNSKLDKSLSRMIENILRWILYVVVILIVAERLGIPTTSLVAAFSVVGLAISLAVQNTLSNVAGGIMIRISKPFVMGDYIETSGASGTVVEIGLSYTRLRTLDNKIISIPNGDLSNTRITDYTANENRRMDLYFTASYEAPIETVRQALLEAVRETGMFLDKPEVLVAVQQYGESSIQYAVKAWVEHEDYWPAYYAMTNKVAETFARYDVEMTYNHLNVHIKQ